MKVAFIALVLLGLIAGSMATTAVKPKPRIVGGWQSSPSTVQDLIALLEKVPGWGDKKDKAEIEGDLKGHTVIEHQSQVVAGTNHFYLVSSLRGIECFILYKNLQGQVSLTGWTGTHHDVDTDISSVHKKCLDSRKLSPAQLQKEADKFAWKTKDHKFHPKKSSGKHHKSPKKGTAKPNGTAKPAKKTAPKKPTGNKTTKTHGKHPKGHGKHPKGHGKHPKGHGKHPKGHGKHPKGHGKHPKGHGKHPKGHGKHPKNHSKNGSKPATKDLIAAIGALVAKQATPAAPKPAAKSLNAAPASNSATKGHLAFADFAN